MAEQMDKTQELQPVTAVPADETAEASTAQAEAADAEKPAEEGKKEEPKKKAPKKPPKMYTIKFIPSTKDDEVKTLHLSERVLKGGIISLAAGALLFVGAFSYSVYSTFAARNSMSEIQNLRQVNSIQQEQLLQLSKKANALQDEMNQLTQLEEDLRRLSGADPAQTGDDNGDGNGDASGDADSNGGDGTHTGQGGPLIQPNVENVGQALDEVEKGLAVRKQSLLDLQQQLQARQQELGLPTMQIAADGSLSMPVMPGGTTPSIWPARGDVSSPFGMRWGGSDFHPGIDIANDAGTPIVATADGVVTTAGWNDGGYGNMVDIDHGNGIMTRYGHAMQVVVTAGQHVRRGQVIAYMGSTGFSTGPHVHYEVRINGSPVNPSSYL